MVSDSFEYTKPHFFLECLTINYIVPAFEKLLLTRGKYDAADRSLLRPAEFGGDISYVCDAQQ